jgi:hypothetical protein
MTPEEAYADRFAEAAVVLLHDSNSLNAPMTQEEKAKEKSTWVLIGKAIYRANIGVVSP